MQTFVLTDLSDEIVERITELATSNHLSFEAQAKLILAKGSRSEIPRDRRTTFEAIAALTPNDVKQTDSTELIREDRDR